MRADLIELYRDMLPPDARGPQAESRRGARLEGVPGATTEQTPLLPEHVGQLERLFELEPDRVTEFLRRCAGDQEQLSREEARQRLQDLRAGLEAPREMMARLERRGPTPPPPGFGFDLYDPDQIPIDTSLRDFEEKEDWFRYAVSAGLNGALFHLGVLPSEPFRRHEDYPSLFTYELAAQPGKDLTMALFADFANGYYHARYIARRLEVNRYPYALYLGDVYYAGRAPEVASYMAAPLEPLLPQTELFLLEGNHEMYSKARPWRDYLDGKRSAHPAKQRQEGTYFRLLRDGYQILGLDTEWFGLARCRDEWLQQWLRNALQNGRREGRMNILLTSDEPYTYGKTGTTGLFTDLADVASEGLIDLWFWGNTHYCALFGRGPQLPFIGTCIGHGGFPYGRQTAGLPAPAPVRFLETGTRFGEGTWPDPRPDRGNNGFCEMTLRTDGSIALTYIDWMGRLRHRCTLARNASGVVDFA